MIHELTSHPQRGKVQAEDLTLAGSKTPQSAHLREFLTSTCSFSLHLFDTQALVNGRPTVVEFYADWCQVLERMLSKLASYKGIPSEYKFTRNFMDNRSMLSQLKHLLS